MEADKISAMLLQLEWGAHKGGVCGVAMERVSVLALFYSTTEPEFLFNKESTPRLETHFVCIGAVTSILESFGKLPIYTLLKCDGSHSLTL